MCLSIHLCVCQMPIYLLASGVLRPPAPGVLNVTLSGGIFILSCRKPIKKMFFLCSMLLIMSPVTATTTTLPVTVVCSRGSPNTMTVTRNPTSVD